MSQSISAKNASSTISKIFIRLFIYLLRLLGIKTEYIACINIVLKQYYYYFLLLC